MGLYFIVIGKHRCTMVVSNCLNEFLAYSSMRDGLTPEKKEANVADSP